MPHDEDNEAGRRLLAAILSYTAGLASVDRTLKKYVPARVNAFWRGEARRLQEQLIRDMNRREQPCTNDPGAGASSRR